VGAGKPKILSRILGHNSSLSILFTSYVGAGKPKILSRILVRIDNEELCHKILLRIFGLPAPTYDVNRIDNEELCPTILLKTFGLPAPS
jgi:hypothetical protein